MVAGGPPSDPPDRPASSGAGDRPGDGHGTEELDPWIGRLLRGRFRIVQELGEGGMATVYLALDEQLDERPVVVKVPKDSVLTNPTNRTRFLREVRSLVRQRHPNIVRVYDAGEHDGHPFLVVEYLEGGDLADQFGGPGEGMSPEEILRWLPAIAEALDGVHQRGVVHRDVKPGNILFDPEGHAFLSDFGIAAQMRPSSDDTTLHHEVGQLTVAGGFVGSPAYAPPEAIQRKLSPAYDQYSLAVVVYRALSGRLPFEATTSEEYLVAKARDEPTPLADVAAAVPPGCLAAVMRAMSRDRDERFPSCGAFADAFAAGLDSSWPTRDATTGDDTEIETVIASDPEPRLGAPPGRVPTDRRRRLAAIAILGAAVVAAWWIVGAPGRESIDVDWSTAPEPATPADPEPGVAGFEGCFEAGSRPTEVDDALALCRARAGAEAGSCERDWYATETLRRVCLEPFRLDRREVTVAEFARFTRATGHRTTAEEVGFSYDGPLRADGLSWRLPDGLRDAERQLADHPVVNVSAEDAAAYCAWAGRRLPTRDEWELAARGPERRVFPWGDRWDDERAQWGSDPELRTAAVGSRPGGATPSGHLDLAGNVWEWTSSRDDRGRQALKGGSFRDANPANLRSAAEMWRPPDDTSSDWGFRCAY